MSELKPSHRYNSQELRDKLAAEYVLGTLPPRVRRRLETLMQNDPSWWEYIEIWQQHFSAFNPAIDANTDDSQFSTPPASVWKNLSLAIFPSSTGNKASTNTPENIKPSLFRHPWFVPVGFVFSLMVGILISPVFVSQTPTSSVAQVKPASYLAMMSSADEPNLFALVAYQGAKPGESNLRLQRNLRDTDLPMENAVVWMVDKDTGTRKEIGSLRSINDTRFMTPTEWKALKNSTELIVTAEMSPTSQVLYRGRCVQLSDWNAI
ncbi:hypothetical protein [Enterovibrio calviensis]|uniref:hypothetical protein n=1 Tax=Enterovibrio calviensis TaxID=91359 RepID=UPI0037355F31